MPIINLPSNVRALTIAAGLPPEEAADVVLNIGAEYVADVLIDELISRADLDEVNDAAPTTVQFDLAFGETPVHRYVMVEKQHAQARPGSDGEPDATVTDDLVALLYGVFGPRAVRRSPYRRIAWRDMNRPWPMTTTPWVQRIVHRLLRGAEAGAEDLAELALRFGSDKWGLHQYTAHYERHFAPLRDTAATVLELGVGGYHIPVLGGGSLRTWKRYFHRAMIYGVDIHDKSQFEEQRIRIRRGSQSDAEFLEQVVAETGPLDVIIDDGSHVNSDVLSSFRLLFPKLRVGGVYVVEDLQTSYWPGRGGTSVHLDDPSTSMGRLKQLVDGLNHEEIYPPRVRPAAGTDALVTGVHFYHNLAFVEKGVNAEGTLPEWVSRTEPE
jgi:hypothetical protein